MRRMRRRTRSRYSLPGAPISADDQRLEEFMIARVKAFSLLVVLLLLVPMAVLNPMGRPAFLGYYAGVIATAIAYVVALGHQQSSATN